MVLTANDLDIKKIKLVIWDLDNTFWRGTISEGQIDPDPDNILLLKELSSRGIVNSICSKNDFDVCRKALEQMGVWEYFVFPSIDWTPKSNRVHAIINDMNLRSANTLFMDDEPANLHRALMGHEELLCGTIQELGSAIHSQLHLLKIDDNNTRLKQYRDLQQKVATRKEYQSDEEFLRIADIKVNIHTDCMAEIDRIFELVNRTNQLNYTKLRQSRNEIETLLKNRNYRCAYISCTDKFCNYGIVGFFALNQISNQLEHFLFSCRTIGMGVEQFVYAFLEFPDLEIVGEVVTRLDEENKPDWIRLSEDAQALFPEQSEQKKSVLIKGPCDVSQIIPYFADTAAFETEFAYVSLQKEGMYVESFNHTSQILLSDSLSENEKKELISTVPFVDEEYFSTKLFKKVYPYVIFSMLSDYGLGMYRHKSNPRYTVAFGQYTIDYTKRENWDAIMGYWIQGRPVAKRIEEEYRYFQENYEYIGRISDEDMVHNLKCIRERLPASTKLIFLDGAEIPFRGVCKPSLIEREKLHKQLNQILRDFVAEHSDNCEIIHVTDYLQSEEPYLDTINHYKKIVYYRLATAIQEYISRDSQLDLCARSRLSVWLDECLRKLHYFGSRIRARMVSLLRKV